ncbi:DEAD/DEAH box helicase family protein [bacterium]|nr:MAG: DEAD/DEAH box helicase family protein [bacterium]
MFQLHSKYKPSGDQPKAIDYLTQGINYGLKNQVLLGATGTGKTFTIANVIENIQKPTLVLAHNKTLAAQLFSEFKEFFPNNAVEYFISYYDYYQPESYVPSKDLYIEKEVDINKDIERYRAATTQSLLTRSDVIIVASVSAIYGLGNPEDYMALTRNLKVREDYPRDKLIHQLIDLQYERSELDFIPGSFRIRGDIIDIYQVGGENAIRLEFFGDTLEQINLFHPLTGEKIGNKPESIQGSSITEIKIFPAKQYVTPEEKLVSSIPKIQEELVKRIDYFKNRSLIVESKRIEQRVNFDIEMLQEVGYVSGIENYSRIIEGREVGSSPSTLLDYFPKDWLLVVDESHMTIPQVRGMYNGDRARKTNLVEYGFRLPSALDNRPLKFEEFNSKLHQTIYVSATPDEYEVELAKEMKRI